MSISNVESWSELNKSMLDQWIKLSQLSIENIERFAALNINTAKENLEEQVKQLQTLPQVKDTQAWSTWRQRATDCQLESFFSYTRKVSEAAAAAQTEIGKLLEDGLQQCQKNMNVWADQATKSAPAGSELAVNAFKNSMAATHAAIDGMSKATRQAAEIADAGVKAAVNATINTVKQAQHHANQAAHSATAATTAATAAATAAASSAAQQANKKAAN